MTKDYKWIASWNFGDIFLILIYHRYILTTHKAYIHIFMWSVYTIYTIYIYRKNQNLLRRQKFGCVVFMYNSHRPHIYASFLFLLSLISHCVYLHVTLPTVYTILLINRKYSTRLLMYTYSLIATRSYCT
jgi:hypothetical protein